MTRPLGRFEEWMVERSVEHARDEGLDVVFARLHRNGYTRVAEAVRQQFSYYVFQVGDRRLYVTATSEREAWEQIDRRASGAWVELAFVIPCDHRADV